jgi:hypothetical protein
MPAFVRFSLHSGVGKLLLHGVADCCHAPQLVDFSHFSSNELKFSAAGANPGGMGLFPRQCGRPTCG